MEKKDRINNPPIIKCIKNIFDKTNFIIEFISTIFFVYAVYMINFFRVYMQIWPLKYILICIPTFFITLGIIIYNCVKYKENVEKIFTTFLIVVGMFYIFFIPPSYVPDENAHISKAYEVSTGKFITPFNKEESLNTEIPKFFEENVIPKIKTYAQFEEAKDKECNYKELIKIETPAQTYPFSLYLISSIAFLLGRIFSINGIFVMYFAKILNFIVFLIAGYYSIKIIPFGKKVLGIIMFLPMTIQQGASISADSILNSLSILYIAYTLYLCKNKKRIDTKSKIMYVIMSLLISISKIAYVPLSAISMLFVFKKEEKDKSKILFIILTILISLIAAFGWYEFSRNYSEVLSHETYLKENNVNSSEQIKNIINNPKNVFVAINEVFKNGFYLNSAIGSNLGWLNINIPTTVVYLFIMLLIISPFLDKNEIELERKEKIWINLIAFGIFIIVILAMYITWTGVGEEVIKGVQGRYFIPIMALPLLTFCGKEKNIAKSKYINLIILLLATYLHYISILEVIKFFT